MCGRYRLARKEAILAELLEDLQQLRLFELEGELLSVRNFEPRWQSQSNWLFGDPIS
jgi:putative SOS response-associated peptidase YedK